MGDVYRSYIDGWRLHGSGGVLMHYSYSSRPDRDGTFGLLDSGL